MYSKDGICIDGGKERLNKWFIPYLLQIAIGFEREVEQRKFKTKQINITRKNAAIIVL